MGIFFLFSSYLFCSEGWAKPIVGIYLPASENPAQTCKVVFWKNGIQEGICSSTLIAADTLLTADHCRISVEKFDRTTIECPNGEVRVVKQTLGYPKGIATERRGEITQDLALLKVEQPFKLTPVRVPRNTDEQARLLKHPTACVIAGYGLDNEGGFGTLKAAKVEKITPDFMDYNCLCKQYDQALIQGNAARAGDSGGSLYCRTTGGEWVLVGVHHGGSKLAKDESTVELLAPALPWISFSTMKKGAESNLVFEKIQWIDQQCKILKSCMDAFAPVGQLSSSVLMALNAIRAELNQFHYAKSDINMKKDLAELNDQLDYLVQQMNHLIQDCGETRQRSDGLY